MICNEKEFKNLCYCLFTPDDFDEKKRYPTIFFTHGAGSRGNDLSKIKNNPVTKNLLSQIENAVIIAPQCSADTWFDMFEKLSALVENSYNLPFVDKNAFYSIGVSMGGYAAYQLMMSLPDLFSAGIVCCGGGMYWNAQRLKNIPLKIFHGKKDLTVLPCESEHMAERIVQEGGTANLTIYSDCDHNCWDKAFSQPETLEWLFAQKK